MGENKNNNNNINTDEEIKELLQKNLELTADIQRRMKKVNNYIIWQQVYGFLKLVIIVTPIVLGAIYLPRLLQQLKANPGAILNNLGVDTILQSFTEQINKQMNKSIDLNNIDPKQIEQYKKLIK